MNLEIVVHCWQYHQELAYQLSSLILNAVTEWKLTLSLCYYSGDEPTVNMLDHFRKAISLRPIKLKPWPLLDTEMFNRSIGRNKAAKTTRADFIWFTDVDFVFGKGCLDGLMKWEPEIEDERVYYPQEFWDQKELSNKYIDRVVKPGIFEIDKKDFKARKIFKACGGLQIVTGDTARKHGYCDGTRELRRKWSGWKRKNRTTRSDVFFRSIIEPGSKGHPIDIPNLYRIRRVQETEK